MIPADVDRRVSMLLDGAASGEKLVNTVHQVMQVLRDNGLVTSMRLVPSAVGVHPKNRDGMGLNSSDVHTLLSNLLEVGFVSERTHCVAIEPASDEELKWNQQLIDSCQGLLGTMKPLQTLKALSLCGSHTNFALRVIADAAPHQGPESEKVTVGGRLDVGLVSKVDAALADHVRYGLNWEVLSSSVGLRWPELLQKKTLSSRPACGNSFPHFYQFALKLLVLRIYRLQGYIARIADRPCLLHACM